MSDKTEKQYKLSNTELNFVTNINNRRDQAMLDFFSYYALERGYKVTENTQFRTDEDGVLYISEREAKEPTEEKVSVV